MPPISQNAWRCIALATLVLLPMGGAYASGSSPLRVAQGLKQSAFGKSTNPPIVSIAAPSAVTQPQPQTDAQPPPPVKATATPQRTPKAKTPPRSAPAITPAPPPPPKFELAVQEDATMVFSPDPAKSAALMPLITDLGATWARVILYPQKIRSTKPGLHIGYEQYQAAINQYRAAGISVELTIACNHQVWTAESFAAFVDQALSSLTDVRRFSICNEPNYENWLMPSPGMSVPDTYCMLWNAGYAKIKEKLPTLASQVLIGELSSNTDPAVFMQQVMRPDGACSHLVADGFAFHPYRKVRAPNSPDSPAATIAVDVPTLDAFLGQVAASGTLVKPEGGQLGIYLTEYGWQTEDRGHRQGVPRRAEFWPQDLAMACEMPHVVQVSAYQIVRSPSGEWNTSIIDLAQQTPGGPVTTTPDPTYLAIQNWAHSHPPCAIDR